MNTQMILRIDPELKRKVSNLAKAEGKRVSEVVRELLEDYVRDRDVGSYVDDLWARIGGKLSSRGVTLKDLRRTIKEARAKK
jgi:predicted DNA-binding protein